ncbi:MAG: hypothetical protein JMN25_14655 [gamma proteobacterium endosymbiont of Lamellibrachia anaximandri]|nr:hypothetical protein [gamma proteobacterium endosymbiont of Lamellibrachia anaximandri]
MNKAPIKGPAKDFKTKVAGLRKKIADLNDQLHALIEHGVTKDEFILRVCNWVDDQAGRFNPMHGISALRSPRASGCVSVFQSSVQGSHHDTPLVVAETDLGPMLCFLFADVIKKRLADTIRESSYEEGISTEERPDLIALVKEELECLELEEEQLILEAASFNIAIPRRDDSRPEIILSLALKEAS